MHRIGLDIGTNSIGWCVFKLNAENKPTEIVDAGVRIFTEGREPKSKASLAVGRREARAARRRRDRYIGRRNALIKALVEHDLMPADNGERQKLSKINPFQLRAEALDAKIPLHHFGRAIFHLNQRRGFKSNRKTDKGTDEKGKISVGIGRLQEAMKAANARTYGEFLYKRQQTAIHGNQVPSIRTRLRPETGEGAKGDGYDFYPDRATIEHEFDSLWAAQAKYHPTLTDQVRNRFRKVIFYQRPLKKPKIGRCTFFPEPRLAKAHPLFQERRLLEEVNALEIIVPGQPATKLSLEQRDILIAALKSKKTVSYNSLRKTLKLPTDCRFNKETKNRDKMLGDEVFAELSHKDRFGSKWAFFDSNRQWEIIERIQEEEDEETLFHWLESEFNLERDAAIKIANARLPEGYGRIGSTATRALIETLKGDVLVYSDAVAKAGETYPEMRHHSDFRTGEVHDTLPYYGSILERHVPPGTQDDKDPDDIRYGRITNPTVHIGLGQLGRVTNALIKKYGHPEQVVVEIARDLKLNDEQKRKINAENKKNRDAAELRGKKLEENNIPNTGENRARLKHWEELNPENANDRRCIYTDNPISINQLFSSAVDVDHILPFSETLDDSNANKVVCFKEANRQKRNKTPFEAFHPNGSSGASWERIVELASRLPESKRWRFQPDAMKRFKDVEDGFLARHLNDTQYLSRMARQYLEAICPTGVYVIPGRMTEMFRRHWGLNSLLPDSNYVEANQPKNRLDHRHHAIDAAVVGVTDRGLLNQISRAAGQNEANGLEDVVGRISPPWSDQGREFRRELGDIVEKIVVSHRPDHGKINFAQRKTGKDQTASQLHNDTAYGLTGETDEKGNEIVVHRVLVDKLKKPKDLDGIRDTKLRTALKTVTSGLSGKAFEEAITAFSSEKDHDWPNLRRIRVLESLKTIKIKDKKGTEYKGYKGDSNYRYDVWQLPNGKFKSEIVSMFDAHDPNHKSEVKLKFPTARKIFKLHQNDMLAFERDGTTEIVKVVKFAAAGQITLAAHNESGSLKTRDASPSDIDPFKYINSSANGLVKAKARQVRINEIGHVFDPGPRLDLNK